jgi:hypothetical protein
MDFLKEHINKIVVWKQSIKMFAYFNRLDLAKQINENWLEHRCSILSTDFSEDLSAILENDELNLVPKERLDWFLGHIRSSVPLSSQINQQNAIDHLLLDWIECKPEQVNQIMPFLDCEDALLKVNKALELGKGVFIASSHTGLLFAGPIILRLAGLDAKWVASVPNLEENTLSSSLLSTSTDNDSALGRKILKALSENKIVGIASDGNKDGKKVTAKLFDKEIGLSEFIPRMMYRKKTPCFFAHSYWQDGTIKVDLQEASHANANQPVEKFIQSWAQQYCLYFERQLVLFPQSARCTGGFWSQNKPEKIYK